MMLTLLLAGCLGEEPEPGGARADGDQGLGIDPVPHARCRTRGATTASASANVTPFHAMGSIYYGGRHVHLRADDGHHRVSDPLHEFLRQRTGYSTAVVAFGDLTGMTTVLDYLRECFTIRCCRLRTPTIPTSTSTPWTSRIMKFDMHALLGMTVEWSDDEGASWNGPSVATASTLSKTTKPSRARNMEALLHPTTWMFCINGNAPHPLLVQPRRRRHVGPRTSGAPVTCSSGGLSGSSGRQRGRQLLPRQQGMHGERHSVFRTTNAHFVDGTPAPDLRNRNRRHLERRRGAGGGRFRRQRPRHVDGPRRHALLVLLARPRRDVVQRDHDCATHRPDRHRIPPVSWPATRAPWSSRYVGEDAREERFGTPTSPTRRTPSTRRRC